MSDFTKLPHFPRLGLHYFPDSLHYRESDLATWLPELKSLGINWLTLVAPSDRAIPESFLAELLQAGIQPILQFNQQPGVTAPYKDILLLLDTYARWGVRYILLFDRPNLRASWPASLWAQSDLVERFLDCYLPLVEGGMQAGLAPVFPLLEPGGDYWDTAFLRAALQGIQRRGHHNLLENLVLSAYAWNNPHALTWGAGGPERWPGARPYFTPPGQENQMGFYIADWYEAIADAVLGQTRPILLFGAGSPAPAASMASKDDAGPHFSGTAHGPAAQQVIDQSLAILDLVLDDEPASFLVKELPPLHPQVIAANFWLLANAASNSSRQPSQAWFRPDGTTLPLVGALRQRNFQPAAAAFVQQDRQQVPDPAAPNPVYDASREKEEKNTPVPSAAASTSTNAPSQPAIRHYLLLPLYEWGVADWHLDVIRPFIKKHAPTVGFSIEEAAHAEQVTVIGGQQVFSDKALAKLRETGCQVERVGGDGTEIASYLATR